MTLLQNATPRKNLLFRPRVVSCFVCGAAPRRLYWFILEASTLSTCSYGQVLMVRLRFLTAKFLTDGASCSQKDTVLANARKGICEKRQMRVSTISTASACACMYVQCVSVVHHTWRRRCLCFPPNQGLVPMDATSSEGEAGDDSSSCSSTSESESESSSSSSGEEDVSSDDDDDDDGE